MGTVVRQCIVQGTFLWADAEDKEGSSRVAPPGPKSSQEVLPHNDTTVGDKPATTGFCRMPSTMADPRVGFLVCFGFSHAVTA